MLTFLGVIVSGLFGFGLAKAHSAMQRATTLPASQAAKIDPTGAVQAGLDAVEKAAETALDAQAAKLANQATAAITKSTGESR